MPPPTQRPAMNITINGSYLKNSSSEKASDSEDERHDRGYSTIRKSEFASRTSSFTSASETEEYRSSEDSGTITASTSSSENSMTRLRRWASRNQTPPPPAEPVKGRDAKKSVSFYLDEKNTADKMKKQGANTGSQQKKKLTRRSTAVDLEQHRVNSGKSSRIKSARLGGSTSSTKLLHEKSTEVSKKIRKGSAKGNSGYAKAMRPATRAGREKSTDFIPKKMGREKTMFEFKRGSASDMFPGGTTGDGTCYMKRSASNLQPLINRKLEAKKNDLLYPYMTKCTSSVIGTPGSRIPKLSEGRRTSKK